MSKEPLTRERAEQKIDDVLEQGGSFTHNLVGLILGQLAKSEGNEASNAVIRDMGLDDLLGIQPVKETAP